MQRAPAHTWADVRRWAASVGLTSAEALARWLDAITPDRAARFDPYEGALVRALQQYAMAAQPDGSPPAPWRLASYYRPVLDALGSEEVARQLNAIGTSAPEWIDPLVNPLAPQAGVFWPASPVTAATRVAQTVYDTLGYRPLDARAFLVSLAASAPRDPSRRRTAGDEMATQLRGMGASIDGILGGLLGLRADPQAPPLASAAEVDAARLRWPSVTPDYIAPPYVVAVGSGLFHGAPSHIVWLRQGNEIIGGVIVDDATGQVVDEDGAAARDQPDLGFGLYTRRARRAVEQASGGQPDVVAEWLARFARATRDGESSAVGLLPVALPEPPAAGWIGSDVERIDFARVVEPAEVLAALSAEARMRAARVMQRALQSVSGLARRASEAYTGDFLRANVPDEVRQLLAVQAASRACGSEAPTAPSQRKALTDAANLLGVPVDRPVESLCAAMAQAAERLYGVS
ncbi:hypothetical protein pneo_cds_847 [Pandoravirus neocaledonia]|uniref:DUF5848 domain-containing protein n=1 Tax=Pandoravirus neocaledonia TaxID=2107708 RepID=A0A2U7UDD5_9VIRU|nr:hypothetical protein pneo_cds_847 [Pandoravirus neocaledonia]AVK76454.1 hypothetical protein pneo_cds_847 [Pandoravirus neocaledonia]